MFAAISKIRVHRVITSMPRTCLLNCLSERKLCSRTAEVGSSSESKHKIDMTSKGEHYDVAVVGGGMVGLALACALSSMAATKKLKLAIIDSNPALNSREIFKKDALPDPRVSTLTPSTISFLQEIGAWDYVQQQRFTFFDQMQVWDYTGLGFTRYNARDVDKDCLGCVVENKVLCNSLLLRLQNVGSLKKIHSAKLVSMTLPSQSPAGTATPEADSGDLSQHGNFVKLDLSDGESIYAKLVVGADGAKSNVREFAGIKTSGWKYSQSAVICTVQHPLENHCAWQRFLPSGPIALLPIGDTYSNIVWTMTPDAALQHKSMNNDDFVKAVNHAMDHGYGPHPESNFLDRYLGRFSIFTRQAAVSVKETFEVPPKITSVVSERMAFPLSLMHARDYASRRVVLIGDAAHSVHPLAGQGVNLGFGDASVLAKVIAEGLYLGSDVGELSLLKKYERERKVANMAMMAILDGFQKAYSVDLGPVNLLRAAAFHGAQYIGPMKKNIISYAMGEQKLPLFS